MVSFITCFPFNVIKRRFVVNCDAITSNIFSFFNKTLANILKENCKLIVIMQLVVSCRQCQLSDEGTDNRTVTLCSGDCKFYDYSVLLKILFILY